MNLGGGVESLRLNNQGIKIYDKRTGCNDKLLSRGSKNDRRFKKVDWTH